MSELIITERSNIVSIADAIRGKANITRNLTFDEIVNSINSISSSGGIDTSDATATAEDISNGKTAYVDGVKIVGTHECEVGTDTSDATITSGAQMLSGVTAYGANEKITGTIPSQGASTITPDNNSKVAISAGTYAAGDITVSAVPTETKDITENGTYTPQDGKYFSSVSVNIPSESFETQSKIIAPNESQQVVTPDSAYDGLSSVTIEAIPSDYVGSSIVREGAKVIIPTKSEQTAVIAGTYVSGNVTVEAIPDEYVTTTDADAIAEDIANGKTAYVNGNKITGTFTLDDEVTAQDNVISQIQAALEGKAVNPSPEEQKEQVTVSITAGGQYVYICVYSVQGIVNIHLFESMFNEMEEDLNVDINSDFYILVDEQDMSELTENGWTQVRKPVYGSNTIKTFIGYKKTIAENESLTLK